MDVSKGASLGAPTAKQVARSKVLGDSFKRLVPLGRKKAKTVSKAYQASGAKQLVKLGNQAAAKKDPAAGLFLGSSNGAERVAQIKAGTYRNPRPNRAAIGQDKRNPLRSSQRLGSSPVKRSGR